MYPGVRQYVGDLSSGSSSVGAMPQLFLAVFLGVVVYVASLTALWLSSGRPQGSETAVIAELRRRMPCHAKHRVGPDWQLVCSVYRRSGSGVGQERLRNQSDLRAAHQTAAAAA